MIKTILFHYTKRQQGVDKKKVTEFFFKLDFRTVSEGTGNFQLSLGKLFTSKMFQVDTVMFLLSCDIVTHSYMPCPPCHWYPQHSWFTLFKSTFPLICSTFQPVIEYIKYLLCFFIDSSCQNINPMKTMLFPTLLIDPPSWPRVVPPLY